MKRRQLQAERLALYLARPDVGKRLREGTAMARLELANILTRAKAVAGRIEQAGPHPDEPPVDEYRLLLEELRECMRLRVKKDLLNFKGREVCDDVVAWITDQLGDGETALETVPALPMKEGCTCPLGWFGKIPKPGHRGDCPLAQPTVAGPARVQA